MLRLGPLRLHWSLPLGAVLFCAAQPRPLLLLAYLAVLAAHVAGHAMAVIGAPLRVEGVILHACGVLAQFVLLALALVVPMPEDLRDGLVRRNGVMLLLNLIPIRPLDGALAWKLPSRVLAARRLKFRGEMRSSRQVQRDVSELLRKIRGNTRVR